MAVLMSMILLAGAVAAGQPRFGLDRDPLCVVSALAGGDLLVLLPGSPETPPCGWRGVRAFAAELGRCQTMYSWWNEERTHNLERAARAVDGVVLAPGETFSFNGRVGPRTAEAGFVEAKVIVSEGYVDGVGGGVCQVASTLYAAGLFAGLDLVERHPHRFRVGYARLGLDATVDFGKKDLRLRNPYPWPVRLEMGRTGPGELLARVTGPLSLVESRFRYRIGEVVPSDRVNFKKVDRVRDPVEFYGRPAISIERFLLRASVFNDGWSRRKLRKDAYESSPWEIRVTEYPGGQARLRGASPSRIARLLEGSRYRVEDALFKDLGTSDSRWLRQDRVPPKRLERFERFNAPASVAAGEPAAPPPPRGPGG
ncbi:MAG: VanW family protein [Deltaproteobacteria bacterium]|nr:VanW family protein [Deltaproteobacteria bacterium]